MDDILAAFTFLTRLPFWRLKAVPSVSFKHIIPWWPLVGWLTGGVTAGVLWLAGQVLPTAVAWLIAIAARLLVTGCLHEDGLADFFDGMGGGTTRERTLAIMKDSHIGTYGVVGLVIYFLLLFQMRLLPLNFLCLVVLSGDCLSKCCAAQIVNLLPYARREEESKAKVVYNRMDGKGMVIAIVCGVLPMLLLLPSCMWVAALFPLAVLCLLYLLMKRRLQGYTGDCCGAVFLLCELAFYLGSLALSCHYAARNVGFFLHYLPFPTLS